MVNRDVLQIALANFFFICVHKSLAESSLHKHTKYTHDVLRRKTKNDSSMKITGAYMPIIIIIDETDNKTIAVGIFLTFCDMISNGILTDMV